MQQGFKVSTGISEALGQIPGHAGVAGIERLLLLTNATVPGRSFHVAVHQVEAEAAAGKPWRFAETQTHPFDEINILLPREGVLRYQYEIDGETTWLEGPGAAFIPAGTRHRMEPVAGAGYFLCIQLDTKSAP